MQSEIWILSPQLLFWNSNVCSTCQDYLIESKVGKINFIESAVGINYPGSATDNLKTLGGAGAGFTAGLNTWIQPTTSQDAATLKTITSEPNLLTGADAFNTPITSSNTYFDIELITPNVSGDLIDRISTALINPITSLEITTDVFGNDRKDANDRRDIGAVQLGLAPLLSLVVVNDQSVDLSWNEPLHHDGLTIVKYKVYYMEPGEFADFVTVNSPNLTTTISSLTNGINYQFYVRAVYNDGGTEINGPESNLVYGTPTGDFGTPNFGAVPGNEQVTLTWSLPDLGGRSFESYIILWRIDGTTDFTNGTAVLDANQTSTIITGLVNNTTYEFLLRVKASSEFSSDVFASASPDAALAIGDLDLINGKFRYYPNPVEDYLFFNFDENFHAKLFAINGVLLIDSKNKKTIDVTSLSSGTYILQIQIDSKIYSGKILKN